MFSQLALPLFSIPHLSPTIQLSDMCFIAMAVLLTILQSLSHNYILMNNISLSLSLSLLSLCLPVTLLLLFPTHPSLFSVLFLFCFLLFQIPLVGQSPRRSLYRTLSDESLCSSHRRALSLASSRSSMLDQAVPNDILFSSALPYHSTLPPRMSLNHATGQLKSEFS